MKFGVSVLIVFAAFFNIGAVHQNAAAQERPRTILSVNFAQHEPGVILAPESQVVLTDLPAENINGQRALKGNSQTSNAEWNEFFHSKVGLFEAQQAYHVTFDYKVLACGEDASFYALLRRLGQNNSVEWTEWKSEVGMTGKTELRFASREANDYYLIVGIKNRGAIAVNNFLVETDPAHNPPNPQLPAPIHNWQSPGGRTYYVDSVSGRDTNEGDSAQKAWRTLERINAGTFAPDDRILLRAGSRWSGFLAPRGSGTSGHPITLSNYGNGPKPRIDAEGHYLTTLFLFNVEQWHVSNLDIANSGRFRAPKLTGVLVRLTDFGPAHHIQLRNLDVHDVMGSNVKSEGGGAGIACENGGDKVKSRFEGLLIEGCHLARTDRNGITMGGYWARKDWFPSLGVVIRNNTIEDFGGDGIVPIGCDGALIERNVLRNGRQRAEDYAAGIWPWSCDNTVIQHNEVSGMKGTRDGQGYDSDWNCQNTLFQYNYSHDNDGGFMLICNDGNSKMPWSIGNTGTIIRYNLSVNDGARTFHITGPCRATQIYNNTFYVGKNLDVHSVLAGDWGGDWTENTRFFNNIFYVEGKARFDFGGMRRTTFENNVFYGNFENCPTDARALTTDPQLVAPGTLARDGYKLKPTSPARGVGLPVAEGGTRDLWGRALTPHKLSIGADGGQ